MARRTAPEVIERIRDLAPTHTEAQIAAQLNAEGFTPGAMNAIRTHGWPGNVRELINRIRRAVVMADKAWIEPGDLGLEGSFSESSTLSLPVARGRLEKELIQKAIVRTNGNIAKAARELDISRPHLYQLMKKHDVCKS